MGVGVNYDSQEVRCITAEKSTARLLIEMFTAPSWTMENMDIKNALIHEPQVYDKHIYVKENYSSTEQFKSHLPWVVEKETSGR